MLEIYSSIELSQVSKQRQNLSDTLLGSGRILFFLAAHLLPRDVTGRRWSAISAVSLSRILPSVVI
ncbi:MAG: hypothetical protein PVI70_19465 [Gammaproteobacteria bacterium]